MFLHQIPVLGGFFRIRLTTIDNTIGVGSVIALILPPDIVIAGHIEIFKDPVRILIPIVLASVPEIIGADGSKARGIILTDSIHQSFRNQVSLRFISTLFHLISDAPHNDGRMVPVTTNGSC